MQFWKAKDVKKGKEEKMTMKAVNSANKEKNNKKQETGSSFRWRETKFYKVKKMRIDCDEEGIPLITYKSMDIIPKKEIMLL